MKKTDPNDLGIFAIYDKKGEKYDTPFFAMSELFAKRRFHLMCDEPGPLKKWSEDFVLERVGIFDVFEGTIVEDKKVILEAKTIVKPEEVKS